MSDPDYMKLLGQLEALRAKMADGAFSARPLHEIAVDQAEIQVEAARLCAENLTTIRSALSLAADAGRYREALELLLNFVRKSRQGYVLVPLADRIAEVTAEYALAKGSGQTDFAAIIEQQLTELRAASNAEIERMNQALQGEA